VSVLCKVSVPVFSICSTKHFILKACQCPIPIHGYIKLFYFLRLLHASTCQCCAQCLCLYLAYATSNTSYWRHANVRFRHMVTLNYSIFSNYYMYWQVSVVYSVRVRIWHVQHQTLHSEGVPLSDTNPYLHSIVLFSQIITCVHVSVLCMLSISVLYWHQHMSDTRHVFHMKCQCYIDTNPQHATIIKQITIKKNDIISNYYINITSNAI
jgi:hypothetical protein